MKQPLFWDQNNSWLTTILSPFSWLYCRISAVRRLYLTARTCSISVPIIIVGNIRIGGSGKTPMVIALCQVLKQQGLKVGIISRGYGGKASTNIPYVVKPDDNPENSGDEPLLIAQNCNSPVVICRNRCLAAQYIYQHYDIDIIISDDGLQHYRLPRDIEIVMIDGLNGLGNGKCLPAGPLRELPERLETAQYVVHTQQQYKKLKCDARMELVMDNARNLLSTESQPLANFNNEKNILALAGIANPNRFFSQLSSQGLIFDKTAFDDHHPFGAKDLPIDRCILMTSKDAVKCKAIVKDIQHPQCWEVPVAAKLPENFLNSLCDEVNSIRGRRKPSNQYN